MPPAEIVACVPAELWERHRLAVANRANFYAEGDTNAADDLVSETYLRACRYWQSFDGRAPLAWLMSILRSVAIDAWKKRTRRATESLDELAGCEPADPCQTAEARLLSEAGRELLLTGLSAPHAEVLVRVAEGQEYAEIGADLGLPMGTVRSRLFRARRAAMAMVENAACH